MSQPPSQLPALKRLVETSAPQQAAGFITLGDDPHGEAIGLKYTRLHEVMGDSADAFAVVICALIAGPVLWVGRREAIAALCPMAIAAFFDPARLILAAGLNRREILWAGEQALRLGGAAAVIIELEDGPDLRESRRLQIAAEEGGGIGLILINKHASSSAAETRWECRALPDRQTPWLWRLVKNKAGRLGAWRARFSPAAQHSSHTQGGEDAPGALHLFTATAA